MTARFINYTGPFGAETIALLLVPPNWAVSEPQLEPQLPADVAHHPISAFESRRVFAGSSRYELTYTAEFWSVADQTEFRIWLNRLKDELVAVPLWTDDCVMTFDAPAGFTTLYVGDHPARSGSEWIIMAPDASAYEIVQVASVDTQQLNLANPTVNAWPAGSICFPLMFGELSERPKLESFTDEMSGCEIKIKENSVFARRLNPYGSGVPTVGANVPNFATTPLWNWQPNWSQVVDTSDADITANLLGFGRQDSKIVYGLPAKRGLEMEFFQMSRSDIAAIERFFFDRRATTLPFMIPSFRGDMRMSQDLPQSAASKITVDQPNEYFDSSRPPHPGDPYIALVDRNGVDPQKVDHATSPDLFLVGTVTQPHLRAGTKLSQLLLARFLEPKLSWTYHNDGLATVRAKFGELPTEYTGGGKTLKQPFFAYILTEVTPYPVVTMITSYENPLVLGAAQAVQFRGTFTPANISHSSLRKSIKLDEQKLQIKTGPFSGNPLAKFFPFRLEGPLMLTIIEGNASDLTEPVKVRFFGEVTDPDPALTSADCIPFGHIFERKLPTFLLSGIDNSFQDPYVNAAKVSGQITSNPSPHNVIQVNAGNVVEAIANAGGVQYFANGKIVLGTDAAHYESRAIIESVAVTGGVQLTLDRPLLKNTGTGANIDVYPGYDGSIDQLDSRYGGLVDFLGAAYAPDTPPGLKAVQEKASTGGKK